MAVPRAAPDLGRAIRQDERDHRRDRRPTGTAPAHAPRSARYEIHQRSLAMPDFTEVPIRTGPAPTGDNRPPGDEQTVEALGAKLKAENEDLALRVIEFEDKLVKVPLAIDGKETAEKIADFVAIVRAAGKEASDRRETAKRPWLVGGKIVDGFFSALEGRIGRVKQALLNRADAYQARLRDEE